MRRHINYLKYIIRHKWFVFIAGLKIGASIWLHHQNRNKHHWQYWMITWDHGHTKCLKMPSKYAFEMVADWMGAGRAITGKWETQQWYTKNKDNIKLHEYTRQYVEEILFLFN